MITELEDFNVVNARYPHIGRRLRDGQRAGFPADIATALFRLMMQHDREFPEFEIRLDDVWAQHEDGTQGAHG